MEDDIKNLGPLATLAGVWEGAKGDAKAPDTDRTQVANHLSVSASRWSPSGP